MHCARLIAVVGLISALHSDLLAQYEELSVRREVIVSGERADLDVFGWMVVSRNGNLFVPQPADGLVRVFSREGQEIQKFGRKGEGPGEFMQMNAGGWIGDTLWISDGRQKRTLFFTQDGKYLNQMLWPARLNPALIVNAQGQPIPIPIVPRAWAVGGFLALLVQATALPGSKFTGTIPASASSVLIRVSNALQTASPIWTSMEIESTACSRTVRSGSANVDVRVPFCPTTQNHFAQNGTGFVWLSQTTSDEPKGEYTVEATHTTGTRLLKRTVSSDRVVVTASEREAVSKRHARASASLPGGISIPQLVGALPRYHPAVDDVFLGEDSTVWVRLPGRTRGEAVLHGLRPSTKSIARCLIRGDFVLMAARRNEVYGVEENPSGTSDIVRYVLVKK